MGQSDIHTSGDRQLPRVAVDESHSEWSWLDAPYDEDQYGSKTTYNYVALLEMLRAATTASVAQEFSDIAFGEVDVLVVKMPTRRYSSDEREEIWRFVNGGGGLLVIGDHTNVFGTSRHINELLEPTGIQLEFDGVNDSFFHQRQVLSNGFGSTHAATINVPPTLMATSCTLALSPPAVPVRIGQSVYADRGEYSNFSFFGDHTWTLGEPAGRVVQVASEAVGRGQVLVFSDSTIFSTFTFAFPGVWESIANGVVFLRSGNSLLTSWTQQLFRWLCLFGLVLLVARHSTPTWSIVTLAVLIGWQGVANDLRARAFNIDSFSDSRRDVGFLYRGNEFLLPLEHETHSWDTTSYHSMFTRVGRVGRIPRVIRSLDEAKGMRALVLISATQISEREVAEVVELVKSGLDLVLVARADGLVDEKLLEALGIGAQTPINKVVLRGEGSAPAAGLYVDSCVSVTGLDPILTGASRETVVGAKEFGEGSVLYLGVGREYAVDRFGTVKSAPTQRQRQFAELMYQALRDGP
ncbi:MAG: hypothetical protein CMJ94_14260 [Planctomycetes bacterium]|nr:hypothetical protein [Planctomycetota bacterium]